MLLLVSVVWETTWGRKTAMKSVTLWNPYLNTVKKWCFVFVWDLLFSQPQPTFAARVDSWTSFSHSEPCHPEVCGSPLEPLVHTPWRGYGELDWRPQAEADGFSVLFLDLNFMVNYFCSYIWVLLLFSPGLYPDFYWFDLKWNFSFDLKSGHCRLLKAQR